MIDRAAVFEHMRTRQGDDLPAAIRRRLESPLDTSALRQIEPLLLPCFAKGSCLILSGDPGVGKTFALRYAMSAFSLYAGAFYMPEYITARALISLARGQLDEFFRLSRWKSLICIDELGSEDLGASGYLLAYWDELLDCRYSQRRSTIIATNLGAADFTARYGERITDRMREWARWRNVTGGSLRIPEAEESVDAEIYTPAQPDVVIMDGKPIDLRERTPQRFDVQAAIGALAGKISADAPPPLPPLREPTPDAIVAAEIERERLAEHLAAEKFPDDFPEGAIHSRDSML